MLKRKVSKVSRIEIERVGFQQVFVTTDVGDVRAVNFTDLTGQVCVGDTVLLNTTAVDLGLGTGGVHFIIANLSNPAQKTAPSQGHIMKLRYTPLQNAVLSAEEDASPSRNQIAEFESLEGMPVVCCELHSQIAPVCAAVKAETGYQARVAYVMTDGAALPIAISHLVWELKQKALIDVTITSGQAFGGDIEAVNLYTALIAAAQVERAHCVIVSQGPGNVGTGTPYGFSGIQQGEAINAARILGGLPIAVPRISFADPRSRHRGVSHHTLTVLGQIALAPAFIAVPVLSEDKATLVADALSSVVRWSCHEIHLVDAESGMKELDRLDIRVTTMGRSVEEDREFFLAASAGGVLAAKILREMHS